MKITRSTSVAFSVLASGAVMLNACSSNADKTEGTAISVKSIANAVCEGKNSLTASGSSAQENAMKQVFAQAYGISCKGKVINYTASGSGKGVSDFTEGITDFAGSDSALKADKGEVEKAAARCGSEAWNLPVVFGPIAVTYNLNGVEKVALSGETLAKIFTGAIKKWDDAAIAKENAGVKLPATAITVVYRSDESGTTDNFQKYLKGASNGAWTKDAGKEFLGGVGQGQNGSKGVVGTVDKIDGAIGYAEWSYAKGGNKKIAEIITSAGPAPVVLTAESAGKTIDGAKFKKENSNDLALDTASFYEPKTVGAYPIVMATYEIVCSKYKDAATGAAVRSFLKIAATEEQSAGLETAGYIPLPAEFRARLNKAIAAVS